MAEKDGDRRSARVPAGRSMRADRAPETRPAGRLRLANALLVLALLGGAVGGASLVGYLLRDGAARAYRQADRCPADGTAPVRDCYTLVQTTVTGVAVARSPVRRTALVELRLASIEGEVRLAGVAVPPPVGKQVSVRRWRGENVLVWIDGRPFETTASPANQQRLWRLGTLPLVFGLVLLSIHNLLPLADAGGGGRDRRGAAAATRR